MHLYMRNGFLRYGLGGLLAAAVVLLIGLSEIIAFPGNERILSLYNIHTKDRLTIVYKKDGRLIPAAVEKLNWMFRDWRRDEPTGR